MAYRFYVAVQGKTPSVHVTWEECKKVQRERKGVLLKGFNDFPSAVEWVEKKGGTLTEEDFPEYVLRSEPILSKPVVYRRTKAVVEPDEIRVYTDGSCLSNPGGPGGFGSVILFPDKEEVRISGHEAITTNNRMEIMAVLSALDYIEQNGKKCYLLREIGFDSKVAIDNNWLWPTNTPHCISSSYGWRSGRMHYGIDITGPGRGSPNYATRAGEVYAITSNSSSGFYVTIKHNNGYYTRYAHMQNTNGNDSLKGTSSATKYIKVGQRVKTHQIIGEMGSTGNSTGVHLHFEIWNGVPFSSQSFDPIMFYK